LGEAAQITKRVYPVAGVVVALVAALIMAGMTAAASIKTSVQNSVVTAAGLLEIYFLIWMLRQT